MTQDEIIRFAIQCHLVTTGNRDGLYMDALTEFAKLVAAKEREACAKVCVEDSAQAMDFTYSSTLVGGYFAELIRARGEA